MTALRIYARLSGVKKELCMFYEVLMEKKADKLLRAEKILAGLSEEDQSDLIAGKSIHDLGIKDEQAYRKDLRFRRGRFGAISGGLLGGLGTGFMTEKVKPALIGAGVGALAGSIGGATSVHGGKDNYYMNDVKRVKDLVKKHKMPQLSDDERDLLTARVIYGER